MNIYAYIYAYTYTCKYMCVYIHIYDIIYAYFPRSLLVDNHVSVMMKI